MKKSFILAVAICLVAGINCNDAGGGGGGLFSAGAVDTDQQRWDMLLMLAEPTCVSGAPVSGANLSAAVMAFPGSAGIATPAPGLPPIAYFPGLRIDYETPSATGSVPEVSMLAYADATGLMPQGAGPAIETPPAVVRGDTVHVHFRFQAATDGEDGDYLLVRILDGSRFRVPLDLVGERLTKNEPKAVDFVYTATGPGFILEFIAGLSSAADAVYLDDVKVWVNGALLFKDLFEEGDYSFPFPVGMQIMRFPLFPLSPAGSVTVQPLVALQGGQSLAIQGGRSFYLYGQGAEGGLVMNLNSVNLLDPYFGQGMMAQQGPLYFGQYTGTDNVSTPLCNEMGSALVSVNPQGAADLSGWWSLEVMALCGETGVFIGNVDAEGDPIPVRYSAPQAPDGDFHVARTLMFFMGDAFTTTQLDPIYGSMGVSLGNAGMMLLNSGAGQAQLLGGYNPATGVLTGQIVGSLPWGGMTCTVSQGMFTATIVR